MLGSPKAQEYTFGAYIGPGWVSTCSIVVTPGDPVALVIIRPPPSTTKNDNNPLLPSTVRLVDAGMMWRRYYAHCLLNVCMQRLHACIPRACMPSGRMPSVCMQPACLPSACMPSACIISAFMPSACMPSTLHVHPACPVPAQRLHAAPACLHAQRVHAHRLACSVPACPSLYVQRLHAALAWFFIRYAGVLVTYLPFQFFHLREISFHTV